MNWLNTLSKIPRYVVYFSRACVVFANPVQVIWHYVRRTSPRKGCVKIRNGPTIHLSGHPHDTITVFVIFAKRDYGVVERDAVVVDVGANIGVFTLYAAHAGARRVFAFEPNGEAHDVLKRNINENRLGSTVVVQRRAVFDADDQVLSIPKSASPYNDTRARVVSSDEDLVNTISLAGILDGVDSSHVDLLKCDCEGAEYPFLMGTSATELSRLRRIRMEYHEGPLNGLIQMLAQNGLRQTHRDDDGAILWFARA